MASNVQQFIQEIRESMTPEFAPQMEILIKCLNDLDELSELYDVKAEMLKQVRMILIHIGRPMNSRLHSVFYGPPGVGKTQTAQIVGRILCTLIPMTAGSTKDETHNKLKEIADQSRECLVSVIDNPELVDVRNCLLNINVSANAILNGSLRGGDETSTGLVCVCGREDLVGQYAGHTPPKTIGFLRAHRGSVIIIEEAYLLYTGDQDQYGMEALTILNRFMDECPETPIFFTGYRQMLEETIFKAQPGLQRRCTWAFELKGYTPKGLASIFLRQLKRIGCELSVKIDLTEFFTRNLGHFQAYGGDTERLAFQCLLAHSAKRRLFEFVATMKISKEELESAFSTFSQHKMDGGDNKSNCDHLYS